MATREELRMLTENLKSTDCIKELRTKEGILNPIEFISEGRDKGSFCGLSKYNTTDNLKYSLENVEVVLKRIKKLKADITLNRTSKKLVLLFELKSVKTLFSHPVTAKLVSLESERERLRNKGLLDVMYSFQ